MKSLSLPFIIFYVLIELANFCKGYISPINVKRCHLLHNGRQSRSSLASYTTSEIGDVSKKVAIAIALGSSILFTPVTSMALERNPEALEMRRVMQQPAGAPEVEKKTPVRLPSGVQYFDYVVGDGAEVQEGKSVQFQWVLRRSNGYFVDASSNYGDEPFIYKVGNTKKVIKGVDEAIRGMKVGGVRRMNIPPNVAFVAGVGDDKPGPMPAGFGPRRQIETRIDREVWYFEIKVTKVK